MKFFKRNFRGNVKEDITNKDILNAINNLNININDRNFDLLDENSELKNKNIKISDEKKECNKKIELLEKDKKNLIDKLEDEKPVIQLLNDMTDKIDLIKEKLELMESFFTEFKGNIYEVKPIRKCTGSKQKMKIKSSSKNSSIIKKVVDRDDEKQTN